MIQFWTTIKDRIQGKAPKGARRNSQWRKIRGKHVEENPNCFVCGLWTKVEVHHVIPFHVAPDHELNPENLMTLCENKKYGVTCHLLFGHKGNYTKANPSLISDAMEWRIKLGKYEKNLEKTPKYLKLKRKS